MAIELLQRQVEEVDVRCMWCITQALLSVYSEEGDIYFSQSESEQLEHARALLDAPQHSEADAGALRISGCVKLPGLNVEGLAVTVKFSLPAEYPVAKPHLQLIANAPRAQLDQLSTELDACVAEHAGSECLLLCVAHMLTEISDRISSGCLSSTNSATTTAAPVHISSGSCILNRTIVWFHHIASPKKRKSMAAWSSDLKVGGYYKIGYPGVLILEGESHAVQQYVTLLRSQRWKAMAVRGEQEEEFSSAEEAEAARLLPKKLVELSEDQLGDMGEACRAAGLESLFLLALKIDRSEPPGTSGS